MKTSKYEFYYEWMTWNIFYFQKNFNWLGLKQLSLKKNIQLTSSVFIQKKSLGINIVSKLACIYAIKLGFKII